MNVVDLLESDAVGSIEENEPNDTGTGSVSTYRRRSEFTYLLEDGEQSIKIDIVQSLNQPLTLSLLPQLPLPLLILDPHNLIRILDIDHLSGVSIGCTGWSGEMLIVS